MKPVRFLLGLGLCLVIGGAWLSWDYSQRFLKPNVQLDDSSTQFFIHSQWSFNDLLQALHKDGVIEDTSAFRWVATYKKYDVNVQPGRYIIMDGMNNNQLVNVLRSQNSPIDVLVKSARTTDEMAKSVSASLEFNEEELTALISNEGFCARYGFTSSTIITLFIPNTYEFYWNTSAEEFMERMAREYKRFWNEERKAKAQLVGLSQSQVTVLASIVQSEQAAHSDERPIVAGLYLNRIKKGMRLESDPTLIFALGDFSIKRVLNVHKKVDSPYNTYMHSGLPPGPILLPQQSSIDAVLNAADHNYIFMCAKEDFSGYHYFSSNYRQHLNYARRYQRVLNQRKVYR
jgi:UPF0755 protein